MGMEKLSDYSVFDDDQEYVKFITKEPNDWKRKPPNKKVWNFI